MRHRDARRERFAQEYLKDLNAKEAAIRAGYSVKGAKQNGARLLADPGVAARVAALKAARAAKSEITAARVLEELGVVSFSNVHDYAIDEDGNVTLSPAAHPDAIRAVASVKRKRRTIGRGAGAVVEVETEIRLWDKPAALRLTGQHLGMYVEKREVKFPDGGGVLAVPLPVDAAQWAALAASQQAASMQRPATVPDQGGT